MGYYMGDASAARHQGGLFSFIGKAIKKVAQTAVSVAFPGVGTVLRAGTALFNPHGGAPQGTFSPSTPPGVIPMASTSPLVAPVSTPPHVTRAARATARKPARNLSGKTLRVRAPAARGRAHRAAFHRGTAARLRQAGYR